MTNKDIMKFVTAKARAASHPIFGNGTSESKSKQSPSQSMANKVSEGRWFLDTWQTSRRPSRKRKQRCIMCTSDHWLPRCEKFLRKKDCLSGTKNSATTVSSPDISSLPAQEEVFAR